MDRSTLTELFDQYLADTISPDNLRRMWETLEQPAFQQEWEAFLERLCLQEDLHGLTTPAEMEAALANVMRSAKPARKRVAWLPYAAAAIVVLCAAAYLWMFSQQEQAVRTASEAELSVNIPPGGNKAKLILSDGSVIMLDGAANGAIAQQGGASIVKLADGALVYEPKGGNKGNMVINTLSTPKGGEYRLTLPDGTKAWLNAASSITYPAAFTGNKRNVSVSGEVYFEVAQNTAPFIVDVKDGPSIEVLGTHFNVNSYADDGWINTTLIQGRVRVNDGKEAVVLKPGQQASVGDDGIRVADHTADISRIIAWKNGLFNFNGLDIRSVMRQLERWYDIDVKFEGPVPGLKFGGELSRDLQLSQILKILSKMEVKYRMEGRTLIINNR